MTKAEIKAREIIANQTTDDLLDEWELTSSNAYPRIEAAAVRGWIMDELEKRYPEEFNTWLDQDEPEDADLKWFIWKMAD